MKKLLIITMGLTVFAETQTAATKVRSLVALAPAARSSVVALYRKPACEIAIGAYPTAVGFFMEIERYKKARKTYIESCLKLVQAQEHYYQTVGEEVAAIKARANHARACSNVTTSINKGFKWFFGTLAATVGFAIAKDVAQEKTK